ncbi:transglutaminase domain-containing protein [Spirosoma sordidisoli]|uniref:Kyphoscoliosis peptidase n=1 Tax=Spirosoma sordidisoli TaxID=2502893 RepID=A0A4Q2UMC1_9BACT|nr:transglutaminase domain-containing protein [Spirosoma sordidisoli]RYC69912.1 Kyphoscoliosis peptidase [Spirosoma sordidisoli]
MRTYTTWFRQKITLLLPSLQACFCLLFFTAFSGPNKSAVQPSISTTDIPRPSKFVTVDYGVIDAYARKTPESATRNLNTLSDYLTAPARSELAKARSVYAWITSHVQYDEDAYSGQRYSSETEYAGRVLRSRKTVCTGFALLYKHLLNRAGIEVVNVKGYSRTNDSEAGQPIRYIDHEWNAVRLDGDWYLVDIAWAQTTAKGGQPNDFYFLTEPVAFGANHFPADQRWQLLDKPFSKAQFDQFPKIYDAYFRLGFDDNFPKTGLIRSTNAVTLTLQTSQPVEFICSLGWQNGSTTSHVPASIQLTADGYRLTVPIKQRGTHTLHVYAKPKGTRTERYKSYEAISAFTIVN